MAEHNRRQFLKRGATFAASIALASTLPRRGWAQAAHADRVPVSQSLEVGPWGRYDASPFRDKPCKSYSSLAGPDGKPIDITWGTIKPEDFGPWDVQFDASELRQLRPVPAPGVHPRIFFGPDDLPEIQDRLKNTKCGRLMWNKILSWSHALRGTYDDQAEYAQPDFWKGSNRGSHGNIQFWYYHDKDNPLNPNNHTFDKLAAGDMTVDPAVFWPLFSYDAYRCLIEHDAAGAKMLASAVMTALRHDQQARDAVRAAKKETGPLSNPVSGGTGGQELGFIYDLLFNFLAPDQKNALHDELAASTWYHDNYGTFNAAVNSRSNWATFSYWLIPLLAIEGEPGFNDLKAAGMYRGVRNMLTYGWYPSGATVEGESKDQLGMDMIIAFARRRGPNLASHPHLRAYAKEFLPHSLLPNPEYISAGAAFGPGGFTRYDLLGGFGTPNTLDVFGLKYMFPDDKRVDWMYRNSVGGNYENLPKGNSSYFNGLLFAAMFPSDFDPANDDPAQLGLGLSYLAGDRGLVMTRSGWDRDAVMLSLHTRGASGGHPFSDRNSFVLAGQGRVWFTISQWTGEGDEQTVVLVDKKAQTSWSPGRLADYNDQPLATFVVGDAKYCWDWDVKPLEGKQGYTRADVNGGQVKLPPNSQPEMHSINDFAYTKHDLDYLNAPLWHLHHWVQKDGSLSPVARTPNYPVRKAFRSVGLVRGKHPYALIVDDIQKGDSVHHYDWNGLLEMDLGVAQIARATPAEADSKVYDITLVTTPLPKDKNAPATQPTPLDQVAKGEPLLLVRLLDCKYADSPDNHPPTLIDSPDKKKKMLNLPADAVSPGYKVLLYPYRQGDPLPETAWNHDHTRLTVRLDGVTDTILFTPADSGKTDVGITRDEAGKTTEVIHVNHPIAPLPEPPVPANV